MNGVLSKRNLHHNVGIMYKVSLVISAVMEGAMLPSPIGPSYLNAMPRQIAELRNEAIRRYNSIKVVKMPLQYSGFCSKSVFKITQDKEQIKRAIEGSGGPTEIKIDPDGELITIEIDNYMIIHIEPMTLPHRVVANQLNPTLVTEPSSGTRPASAAANSTQREAAPRARQPPARKKKNSSPDVAYVPARPVTVENKEYPTRDRAQAVHFKRIQLSKIQQKRAENKIRIGYLHTQSKEAEQEAKRLEEAKRREEEQQKLEDAKKKEAEEEAERIREAERELLQTPPPLVIDHVESVTEEPSTSAFGQILEAVTHMDIKEEPVSPIAKESFASFEEISANIGI